MLKGIDINETFDFVSALDTDGEKTVFVVGNILHQDKLRLFAGIVSHDGSVDLTGASDKLFDIVVAGLKKIKNLNGVDYEPVTREALNRVPFVVLTEVLGKIIAFNQLGEIERKN